MKLRPRLTRPFAFFLVAVAGLLALSYFPLARIRAAGAAATILPSAGRPLVNLRNPQNVKVTYTGSADAVAALKAGTANPTALASADFDADGAMDVVAGYSTKNGGVIALYKGNPDAFAPTDSSLYAKAMRGNVPPTFLSKAKVFAVPESPDLIVTGDFNCDGYKDVLVAARGGSLYFLAGDGHGNLLAPQPVALADQVMALAAAPDGHVAVSTDGRSGQQVTILSPSAAGLSANQTFSLPARGTSLEFGALGGGTDLAVAAGSNLIIVYGALTANTQTETVSVPFNVQALALGDFIWDRDGRTEIAALAGDGSVHILQHGRLDSRPVTAADATTRRRALRMGAKSKHVPNPTALGAWTVAKQLAYAGSTPAGPISSSAFSSPRLAASSTHDVMAIDAARSQLNILDTSGKTPSPSASVVFSGTPVAALALPQKIDAGRDIVVLTSAQVAPMLVTSNATLTLNVNTTADIDTVNACATNSNVTTAPATLSLREAVCIANNNGATTVTINVPAGTYDLAISTFGGNDSASSSPELQIGIQAGNNITISGAGAGSTIIQQTETGSRIIEADQELNGNMPLVIQNLSLQLGNCTDSGLDCTFNGGGAILAGGATGDTLTITSVDFNHNSTQSSGGTLGGAVFYTGSSLSITSSTFSSNTASGTGGAGGGAVHVEDEIMGSSVPGSVTIINSTFSGNSAISGNNGNANSGGLYFEGAAGFNGSVTGSTFTGNTASSTAPTGAATGGGITAGGGGTDTFSVSNSRIAGNSVSASSAVGSGYYGFGLINTLTNNWWGCNGGPGATGCDTVVFDLGDGGSGTFSPWLVLSVSANPTQINTSATSTLTADLTHNSNGVGGFSVPDGTPVSFGGTLDSSVNPTSTTTSSGQATSTYTAGNTPGTGTGTAKVDNQTVSVNINIGAPPTITSGSGTTFTFGTAGSFLVTTTGSPTPSLSKNGGLPGGVGFHDNGNGTATISGTPGSTGSFPITITASNGVTPNATQSFTLAVSAATPSISISSVNPSSEVYGQNSTVTITALLSWSGTGTAPTAGDITIGGNGPSGYSATTCGSPSGDTLTCMATYTPTAADTVGSYTESASFSGDGNYTSSGSTQTNNFSITQATSSTSVGSSLNPSLVGQSVTFTATIDGENGEIVLHKGSLSSALSGKSGTQRTLSQKSHPLTIGGITGTVTWSANTGCSPTSVSGDPGTSQCTTTSLPQGTDTITATYSGDTNHSGSSGSLSGGQVVNPSATGTSIVVSSVSPSSEGYGHDATVTITAVLSWTGSGPAPTASDVTIGGNGPSGYGSTTCGAPSSDTMTCTASYTPSGADTVGTYTESASFTGDGNYTGSSSTQTNNFSITQATSSTSVGSSLNPSLVGQSVTFTATIDGEYGLVVHSSGALPGRLTLTKRGLSPRGLTGQAHPPVPSGITGTVTWSANTGCSPTSVSGDPGTSQCITTTLPQGTDTITATYSGDTNHSGSGGTLAGGQVVNPVAAGTLSYPPTLDFGTVYLNSKHKLEGTIKNTGTANVTFTGESITGAANAGTYTLPKLSYCTGTPLKPGKTCTVAVNLVADAAGMLTATLNLMDNASGNPQQIGLTANVIDPIAQFTNPVTHAILKTLSFGGVAVNGSKTLPVQLTNVGQTELNITNVSIAGSNSTGLSASSACGPPLAPTDSCMIQVTFAPTAKGARAGSLVVTDSVAAGKSSIPISATGK